MKKNLSPNKFYIAISFILIILIINVESFSQDTLIKSSNRFNDIKLTSLIFPAALIGYGLTTFKNSGIPSSQSVYDYRQKHFSNFHSNIDGFLAFAPALTAYTLQIDCYKGKNNTKDMTIIFAISNIAGMGSVYALKNIIKHERPDNSDNESFPSGHTTFAFIGADMLYQEYGDKSIWFSIGGYTAASAVGLMRILNNKHYLSDVLVGAGIGILSSRLSYLFYYKIIKHYPDKSNKLSFNLIPDIQNQGLKFSLSYLVL